MHIPSSAVFHAAIKPFALLVTFTAAFLPDTLAVQVGAAEAQVIAELGTPQMEKNNGASKVMYYGNGMRITIRDGKVVDTTSPKSTPRDVKPQTASPTRETTAASSTPPRADPPSAETHSSRKPDDSLLPKIDQTLQKKLKQGLFISLIITFLVYYIGIVCIAFKDSTPWGFICFFVPAFVHLYMITHWKETWRFALICVAAGTVQYLAYLAL